MRLRPGLRVGPYEVVSPLGAGGMAEVYRARDTRLDREIARPLHDVVLSPDGRDIAFGYGRYLGRLFVVSGRR